MKRKIISIYSLIHFIVDLSCAILVTNLVTQKMGLGEKLFIAIILYNFFAFAVQLPVGIIADKVNKNALCSAIGCLLVAVAYAFSSYGIIACIIAGIGNSMFHVGGGIDVLNISEKKATLSGIYVSTGAMGIFLGSMSAKYGFTEYYIIVLTLIFSAGMLAWLYAQIKDKVKNVEMIILKLSANETIAVACLVFTVCIRSFVGLILSFEWKANMILAVLSIFAVILGKMFGGIIGDRIGFKKISIISLSISSVLFLFAFSNPASGILAILFFNMTMPITLTALSNILDNNRGMAFGLLTLALFVGSVPKFFGIGIGIFSPIGLFVITFISLVVLYVGIKKYDKYMEKQV